MVKYFNIIIFRLFLSRNMHRLLFRFCKMKDACNLVLKFSLFEMQIHYRHENERVDGTINDGIFNTKKIFDLN